MQLLECYGHIEKRMRRQRTNKDKEIKTNICFSEYGGTGARNKLRKWSGQKILIKLLMLDT